MSPLHNLARFDRTCADCGVAFKAQSTTRLYCDRCRRARELVRNRAQHARAVARRAARGGA